MVLGHASDGDSRRRKNMMPFLLSKDKLAAPYSVDHTNFSAAITLQDDLPIGMADQDFIHNGKKLINPMDLPSRKLMIGKGTKGCVNNIPEMLKNVVNIPTVTTITSVKIYILQKNLIFSG